MNDTHRMTRRTAVARRPNRTTAGVAALLLATVLGLAVPVGSAGAQDASRASAPAAGTQPKSDRCAARIDFGEWSTESRFLTVTSADMSWWRSLDKDGCRVAMRQGTVVWDAAGIPQASKGARFYVEERTSRHIRRIDVLEEGGRSLLFFKENGLAVDSARAWFWARPMLDRAELAMRPAPSATVLGSIGK